MKWGLKDKTVWDLISLLLVPIFLSVATWVLQKSFNQSELLKAYFKDVTDIMNNSETKLIESTLKKDGTGTGISYNPIQQLASARTLVVLHELYPEGRSQIAKFISDADLFDNIPFERADLSLTDLRFLSFTNSNLQGANLDGAKFDNAILKGANLLNISYKGASFKNATYNECTIFPKDFNPREKGMIYKERTEKERKIEGEDCRWST